jgi:hypothetical protein
MYHREQDHSFPKEPYHPACPNLPPANWITHSPTDRACFLKKSKLVAIPLKPSGQLERETSIFVPVPLWS